MFKKILIANRGEIACRIIKTARHLGIKTVAVYSEADRGAEHVRLADEACHIGPSAAAESYLLGDKIIAAATESGVEAIHPGYGFLSENAGFARQCAAAGITFIGPSAENIEAMGLKDKAKDLMAKAGVPVVPGYQGGKQDPAFLQKEAEKIGFPVLIKAVAGGGGKGMRKVESASVFAEALQSCQREAKAAFGNDHVLIEKFIEQPRHIEVQIFGDSHGNAVHLFERDCSLQRRHQKVVEEAPAPGLPEEVRQHLGQASVKAVKALGYKNAGTIEYIMDAKSFDFYFMEMNTRLQVEHPVTEMITGQDLVAWQLRVAAGEPLPVSQDDLTITGHALEVRLYAEDPARDFVPQTGKIESLRWPENTGQGTDAVRVDSGVAEGGTVTVHYDPMIAKIIVHGPDRSAALGQMKEALAGLCLSGLRTNQEFLSRIIRHDDFSAGKVNTGFIAHHQTDLIPDDYGTARREDIALAAIYFLSGLNRKQKKNDPWQCHDNWRLNGSLKRTITLVDGTKKHQIAAALDGPDYHLSWDDEALTARLVSCDDRQVTAMVGNKNISARLAANGRNLTLFSQGRTITLHLYIHGSSDDEAGGDGRVTAPMPGKVVAVMVAAGERVDKDQPLLIMEAMKMEMTIRAGCDGVVEELPVAVNDQVEDGALLVAITEEDAA